jgi:cytochrome c biogenesis protein CcdA
MIGEGLTLGLIIGAALADSINPCVFGVLIFLLVFMTKVFKNRQKMLLGGLLYAFVVYATYLALGFGILKIAISVGFANAFYWVAAIIAILAGLVEIKDFFWYGKGFSLQMLPGANQRIKFYTSKIATLQKKKPNLSLIFIALLGIFVVLVELPCTGAPYFAILALLAKGSYTQAIPYLLLYNFIFIVPLFFIIAIAYFGRGKKLQNWKEKHKGLMRLVIGLFLIALGGYMIYSITAF